MRDGFEYWVCPFCNVIIPLFRSYPNMWEKRIENHFFKSHLEYTEGGKWEKYLKLQKRMLKDNKEPHKRTTT